MIPFRAYLAALARFWWVPLVVLVVSLGSAWVFTVREAPVYRASASLIVVPNSRVQEPADILRSLDTLDRRTIVATIAQIPGTAEARDGAAGRIPGAPAGLARYGVRATVLPNTNIIRIDVTGPSAEWAAAFANALAAETEFRARDFYVIYKMLVIAAATPPGRPESPNPRRNYSVAGILGLLAGLALAIGVDSVRPRPAAPRS